MGLFDIVKDVGKKLVKATTDALDTNTALFSHPIEFITKGKDATISKTYEEGKGKTALNIVKNTATAAAALVGGSAAATSGALKSGAAAVGKKAVELAITKPIQTAVGLGVGVPLVAGVISKKPEIVTKAPQVAFNTGQGLVDVITEHPTATALIGSIGGGVAAYEIGKNLLDSDTQDINLNSGVFGNDKNVPTAAASSAAVGDNPISGEQESGQGLPTTPVKGAQTGVSKRKKAKPSKMTPQNSIRIYNKNYIKAAAYAR